jgi:ABC-type transport system involved in multi-copper enzyme maturation permease subunit
MRPIIQIVIKEKLRSKIIYVFGLLGALLMVLISTGNGLSINGIKVTDFEQRVPVAIAMNSFVGCITAIVISLQTIPNEIERKTTHLILSRKVERGVYMFSLSMGNIVASVMSMFALNISLFVFIALLGRVELMVSVLWSTLIMSINVIVLSAIVSALSIRVPLFINAILILGIYFLGVFHNLLSTLTSTVEGPSGLVFGVLLNFIPNFSAVQKQAASALINLSVDFYPLVVQLIFAYAAVTLSLFMFKQEV